MKKLKNKDIDLLSIYKKRRETSVNPVAKYMLFPCISAVALCSLFGYFAFQNNTLNKDIAKLNADIQEIQNKKANDPNVEKLGKITEMLAQASNYQLLYDNLQSYPALTQQVFDKILLSAGLNVNVRDFSYTRESQVISLSIDAFSASETELFVRRLRNTEAFTHVTYSGYSRSIVVKQEASDPQKNVNANNNNPNTNNIIGNQNEPEVSEIVYTATVLCFMK